jgi:hypothetical protein
MDTSRTAALDIPELNTAASIANGLPGMETILYFLLGTCAMRDKLSLSRALGSQFAILRSFKA